MDNKPEPKAIPQMFVCDGEKQLQKTQTALFSVSCQW